MKVRQPLKSAEIALSTSMNLKAHTETIKEELNVKEVIFLESPKAIADISVKPNAKILGPRLGKKIQEIIHAAKKGNFKKNEDGSYEICNESILAEEIEISYVGKTGKDILSSEGIVISMDCSLTESLKREGQARDIVRMLQDMRKEANYDISDTIFVSLQGADEVINEFGEYICNETLSTLKKLDNFDIEKIDNGITLQILKK